MKHQILIRESVMCLERAQLEDYNQNNYSGLTPASGLLANDSHNTNGWISICLFACAHEMCVQILCVCVCVFQSAWLPQFFTGPKIQKINTQMVNFWLFPAILGS